MKHLWNKIKLSAALHGEAGHRKRFWSLLLVISLLLSMAPNVTLFRANAVQAYSTEDFMDYVGCEAYFTGYLTPLSNKPEEVSNYFGTQCQQFSTADYKDLKLVIVDCYYNAQYDFLWYKVAGAPGVEIPEMLKNYPWVFQDQVINSIGEYSLNILPKVEKPTVSDPETGISVSGDLPANATLEVVIPTINGEALPNAYDIKIYDENGNEWQPIDEDKMVTIKIPVDVDENVAYVDAIHFIDYMPAIHDNVYYMSIEGLDNAALLLLEDAISSSDRTGYVAVEAFSNLLIEDGAFSICTNSFSIYKWENGTFNQVGDNQNQTSEKFNNSWGNDKNNQVINEYYATKDHLFKLTTSTIVSVSSCAFSIIDSVNVTSGTITGTFNTTVQGAYLTDTDGGFWDTHDATVVIPESAVPGETIVVRFKGASYTFYLLIHIVDAYTIDYQSPNVSATNLPTPHTDVTDGIKESYTIPNTVPEPADQHYEFAGWNTSADGSGVTYQPGDKLVPMRSMTLYAMWTSANSIVKFDANGGFGTYADQTVKTGDNIVLPAQPSRANYVFLGWSATTDGFSALYAENSDYQVKQDVTLYAIWGVRLTVEVTGGNGIQIQRYGTFTPVDILACKDDNNKTIFSLVSEANGKKIYEGIIVEGYLQNAIFYFTYASSLKATADTTDKTIQLNNFTNEIRATVSENGITAGTTISFAATQKQSFIISFDSNGGSSVPSISVYEKDSLASSAFPENPTKQGYYFDGWYNNAACTGDKVTELNNITANKTLYAKWTANNYKITYNSNGGNTVADKQYTIESQFALPSTNKIGYTFAGWKVTTAGGSWVLDKTYSGNVANMYGNVTLTARWTINKHTISFDTNGGNTIAPREYEYGTRITALPVPTKTGYTFVGWLFYTGSEWVPVTDAQGNISIDGVNFYDMADEDIVVSAQWDANRHTITWYDGFGNVLKAEELPYGETIYAPSVPSRDGYTFSSWNIVPPVTMPDADVEITAVWRVGVSATINNNGAIRFEYGDWTINGENGAFAFNDLELGLGAGAKLYFAPAENYRIVKVVVNGVEVDKSNYTGEQYVYTIGAQGLIEPLNIVVTTELNEYTITWIVDGNATTETYKYGENITVPTNPTKEGYTFAGWGATVPTTMPAENLTFTAQWTKNSYTIEFQLGLSSDRLTNATEFDKLQVYHGDSVQLTTVPTAIGATFMGWDADGDGEVDYAADAQFTAKANMKLVAVWNPVPYRVIYTVNGIVVEAKPSFESQQGYYGDSFTLQAIPTVNGHDLVKIQVNGAEVQQNYTGTFVASDVNVVITYAPKEYTITFNSNGGTTVNAITENYGTTVTAPAAPTKTGYTFGGWYADVGLTQAYTFSTMPAANITLYAKWTINQYNVTWIVDGETTKETYEYGAMPVFKGSTDKAPTAQYSYTFAGWDKTIVAVTGEVTYTAQYSSTVNKYTVTWKNWDGTIIGTDSVAYGSTPVYSGATPTKAATAQYTYTFAGWSPVIEPVTGEVTYTAQYSSTVNKYTVTWKNWDGTVLETDTDVPYGTMPSYNGATPTKFADADFIYTFVGWSPEVSGVTGDVTYVAQFAAIPKLTISVNGGDGSYFIFRISGSDGSQLIVTVAGGGRVVVQGLKVGVTYKVEEIGWSWKYGVSSTSPEFTLDTSAVQITFVAALQNSGWLDGESYNKTEISK